MVCVAAYFFVFLLRRQELAMSQFIQFYLTDFLCLPIILCLTLMFLRLYKKNEILHLTPLKIIAAFIYVSLLFEIFLPKYFSGYTADIFDVVSYGFWGIIYYFIQKRYL